MIDLDGNLWTVQQAAAFLGLPEKTVYNSRGGTSTLLRVKQGRNVRLLENQVRAHKEELIRNAAKVRRKIGLEGGSSKKYGN